MIFMEEGLGKILFTDSVGPLGLSKCWFYMERKILLFYISDVWLKAFRFARPEINVCG